MRPFTYLLLCVVLLDTVLLGQSAKVPPLLRFQGTYTNAAGTAGSSMATFGIYATENSSTPLWMEMQRIDYDKNGDFSVVLGSTSPDGLPLSLFQNGQSRWLEVEIEQIRQRRVALVSVPYALKAADAETLGGLPASAYLRAAGNGATASGASASTSSIAVQAHAVVPQAVSVGGSGTANYLAMFSDSANLMNSAIHQSGNTVSIGGTDSLGAFTLIGNVPNGDAAGMALYNIGAGAGASVSLDFYNTWANGGIPQSKIKAVDDGAYSDHLTFWTKTPGAAANPVTEKMRITSAGKVGIGTTTPQQLLEVNGNAQVNGNLTLSGNLLGAGSSGSVLKSPNDRSYNFGAGLLALSATTTGTQNTATGYSALSGNTSGTANTAVGNNALAGNITGTSNTAVGMQALATNKAGTGNVAIGAGALNALSSGNYNVAVGYAAGGSLPSGSNNIYIGSVSAANAETGAIRIGSFPLQTTTFIAGIFGTTTGSTGAVPVVIDANGQLGTFSSSRRYKEDIQDMGDASSGLMRLRPVTFRYKKPFADGSKPIQYGLIAEEVAEVYPDLVARGADGQIETVKYEVLDSMILNEVQKLRAQNAADQEKIRGLEERLARLETLLNAAAPHQ